MSNKYISVPLCTISVPSHTCSMRRAQGCVYRYSPGFSDIQSINHIFIIYAKLGLFDSCQQTSENRHPPIGRTWPRLSLKPIARIYFKFLASGCPLVNKHAIPSLNAFSNSSRILFVKIECDIFQILLNFYLSSPHKRIVLDLCQFKF